MLVVASKIKVYLKEKGMRSSKELAEALDVVIKKAIDSAVHEALLQKRKTVKAVDVS